MPGWKKRIFVRVIKARIEAEQSDLETVLADYPKLTDVEKDIIREEINK